MMEIPNQHPKKWWDHFAGMVNIQTTDSDVERKGKILALYIMLLFGIVVYILINNLYVIAVYLSLIHI